jgi:hypothetical protein
MMVDALPPSAPGCPSFCRSLFYFFDVFLLLADRSLVRLVLVGRDPLNF